jgi:hypothetical protein
VGQGRIVGEDNADEAMLLGVLVLEGRMERVPDSSTARKAEDEPDVSSWLGSTLQAARS